MPPRRDLSGQRFGRLTAVRSTDERRHGNIVWECTCDCGNTTFVTGGNLVSGEVQSCGCLKKKGTGHDLTGQRFGMLSAVRPTENRQQTNVIWECLCDCGNAIFVSSRNLLSGDTKSCGCLKRKAVSRDLTNQRFGKLTVVRPTEGRQHYHIIWECLCDCGNTTYVNGASLVNGNTKSCGCLRRMPRRKKANAEEKKQES